MKNAFALCLLVLSFTLSAQNNALDFDGVDDYVTTSLYTDLSFQSFAIEGWFKADALPSAGNYPHIFGVMEAGSDAAFVRINGDSKKLEFVMNSSAGLKWVTSTETIQTGVWYHAAILYHKNGLNDAQYLLINGAVVASQTFLTVNNYSNQYFRIGGDGSRNFDGQVDDVKVWANIIRSTQDVRISMYKEVVGNESNLMAYYDLDETSGTTANDSQSSSTYDGTLTNMTGSEWTTSSAFFGPKNCLNFDGLDGNVWCPSITPTVTSGTIEFWVNLDVIPADNARLISRHSSYGYDEIYLLNNSGKIYTAGSFVVGDDLVSTDPLPTGVWTHVAITADGSGSKLYINGILDDIGGAADFDYNTFRFGGQYTAGFYEGIDGKMDEVRLWNDVRTEAEIRENMYKSLVGDESNLVAYYNLDNAYGTAAQCYPTAANEGSIGGGVAWVTSTAFNTWLNTDNSTWSTASNWSNGVPVATDNVGIFDYTGGTSPTLSGTPTVNDLVVGSTSDLSLSSNLTVNGNLYLYDDLDLNGQTITLGSSSTLYEDNGLISGSTGTITTTRNLSGITDENVAGFGATITTAANMGSTTIIRGHSTTGVVGLNRYYQITPTTNTALDATLVFNYDDSEINAQTESSLKLYQSSDGSAWSQQALSTVDIGNNTLTLASIESFSWLTGADRATTVTTQAVSSILKNTATGNGNITELGVTNPTEHGVCWSTSSDPTISDSKTTDGAVSAIGVFTSSITGLLSNTTYYVKAYATNSTVTSYGSEVNFTTRDAAGNALDFDGIDDYVEVTYSSALNPDDFTVEAWVKTDNASTTQSIFSSRENFKGYTMYLSGSDVVFQTGNGSSWDDLAASYTVTTDWMHIALVYTSSSKTKTIYVNGVEINSGTITTYSKNATYRQLVGAGEPESVGENFHFNGAIDVVRIWNDVRTETEIRANMYQELAGSETGLVAYYKFNEASGTNANDAQTSSSHDGTLNNMAGSEWTTSSAFFGPKKALHFNFDDYVSIPSVFGLGTTSVSGECWVNLPSTSEMGTFINVGGGSIGYAMGVGVGDFDHSGNNLIFIYDLVRWIDTGVPLGTGWHHVAYTIDASGRLTAFIDGVNVFSETGDPADPIAPSGSSYIGATNASGRLLTNGIIDEVRIWSDIRTESEIRENMCKTLIGNETNLVGYYNLDNLTSTIADYSGNGNDGTIGGDGDESVASTAFNTWLDTDDSNWSAASNWSNGIPVSTDNVGIYNYSVGTLPSLSGTPTVNNLVIGSLAGLTLASNATVTNSLFLFDDVDLNSNEITIGTSGTLFELGGLLTGGDGFSENTQILNNITSEDIGGLGAEITTSANMGSAVIQRFQSAITGPTGDEGINRFYKIEPTNNAGLNATLVFHYDDSELNGKTEANLKLFKSDDDGSTWIEVGGTVNSTDNTITLSSISDFSWWTAAESGVTLPVELLNFSGKFTQKTIELKWSTASESNSDAFIIERSINAMDFDLVSEVRAAGNSNEHLYYTLTDNNIESGIIYYYRLSQRDYDGTMVVHKTISIGINEKEESNIASSVYPNPCANELSIKMSSNSKVNIQVINITGSIVIQQELDSYKGTYKLGMESLPQGVYYMSLKSNNLKEIYKIIKL